MSGPGKISTETTMEVRVRLTQYQAECYRRLLSRAGLSDYRALAASESEAHAMLLAGASIHRAIEECDDAP